MHIQNLLRKIYETGRLLSMIFLLSDCQVKSAAKLLIGYWMFDITWFVAAVTIR